MPKIIFVGQNFLHSHPHMEQSYVIPLDHVIVDRKEWEQVIGFFMIYPELVQGLSNVKEFPLPEKTKS
jgi:hypothetical protein